MKTFSVQIKATIIKTIEVEAADEDSAVTEAEEMFSSASDGTEEKYEQDVLIVEEVA
jgi:hypothetical protein